MNGKLLIIGALSTIAFSLNAQSAYLTENENDIYWQPGVQIDFSDYQSPNDEDCLKYNEKYGLVMSSNICFRGVVDIPTKKRKHDKFYIAPVFCKNCSCVLSEDSLSLKVDRLLFDVAESCTRKARQELLEMQKELNIDNTYTMFFTTVERKWDEKMRSFWGTIIKDILIDKKDSAYISWRNIVDDVLLKTEDYATQPEDCHRLITKEPIEKGYIMPETIMGDMRSKKEEKE